jgi:hypothetical protein
MASGTEIKPTTATLKNAPEREITSDMRDLSAKRKIGTNPGDRAWILCTRTDRIVREGAAEKSQRAS